MPTMSMNVRVRLSIMMFLQYAFQGIWVIPLVTYLGKEGYTGSQIGSIYGTIALGFIIAPFFVGMIADRFFSAQKVLGVMNILAGVLLLLASKMAVAADGTPQFSVFFWIMLAHCICYTPSWALTNTIALSQMSDPGKQFPGIRVMGTIGWIVVSAVTLLGPTLKINIEATNLPMIIGAVIGIVTGVFSFMLPSTPPKVTDHKTTIGDIIGIKALGLMKDSNFAIFVMCSFLIMLPGTFYWTFCNGFLNEIGMEFAQFKQSTGQMSELVFMLIMPFFFARFGVKKMLLIGMLAWVGRFVCFAFGDLGSTAFLLYMGLILHGVCFDFFFVTGQLYTDKKAPKEIQASAQGFISLITFGLGWLVGTKLAGLVVDKFATEGGHNWKGIWLIPAVMAAVIAIIFFLSFHDKTVVGQDKPEQAAA